MSVYVDNFAEWGGPLAQFGRMKMSHMFATSTDELLAMADKIGLARKWIQKPGTRGEHFDVSLSLRAKAIAAGAIHVHCQDGAIIPWSAGVEPAITRPVSEKEVGDE